MESNQKRSSFSDGIIDHVPTKPKERDRSNQIASQDSMEAQQRPPSPSDIDKQKAPQDVDNAQHPLRDEPAKPASSRPQKRGPRTSKKSAAKTQGTDGKDNTSRQKKPGRRASSDSASRKRTHKSTKQERSRSRKAPAHPAKQMLINVIEPEEGRIAILENGTLEELYVERSSSDRTVGNIYKGKVTNVEPGIQAAFIDIGLSRNGFLHISDVVSDENDEHTDDSKASDQQETPAGKRRRRPKHPIQRLLRRGDEILVQITRAGIGTKGPSLTMHISLPGRYLVLVPQDRHFGVSRKILDDKQRDRLRNILDGLAKKCPYGIIARTAGSGASKRELARDLTYLTRLWKDIEKRSLKSSPPAVLYTESDLVIRCLRDVLTSDTDQIVIDSEEESKKVRDFLRRFSRASQERLKVYKGHTPLFHKYGLEPKINQIHQAKLALSQGGSIVIQQTEAMVAIDVNSGRFVEEHDPEETAFKTNLEAAPEIARQLRLRDLGGVIVIDFIDMYQEHHKREIERTLSQAMKRDRARATILRMSRFCLVEMTRQRVRTSLERTSYETCTTCNGRGIVKSSESVGIAAIRQIRLALNRPKVNQVEAHVHPDVAWYLQNKRRQDLSQLEMETQHTIVIHADYTKGLETSEVVCYLDDGKKMRL